MEVELSAEQAPQPPATPWRPRRALLLAVVAAVALVLDVVTKVIVVAELEGRQPIELVGGLLTLNVIRNPGAAFGIAGGLTVVLSVIMIIVVVAIIRTARRLRSRGWAVALGLILGGALGNFVDRIAREPGPMRGHVVDWIQLPHWPIFNIADSAIVCGGVLTVILALRGVGLDGTRETSAKGKKDAAPTPETTGRD